MSGLRVTTRRRVQFRQLPGDYPPAYSPYVGQAATVNAVVNVAATPSAAAYAGQAAVVNVSVTVAADHTPDMYRGQEATVVTVVPPNVLMPRRLVDLATPYGTLRFATSALDQTSVPYAGRLVEEPTISRRMRDDYWGEVDAEETTFGFAMPIAAPGTGVPAMVNGDMDALPGTIAESLRGYACTISRFDAGTRELFVEMTGVVDRADVAEGLIRPTVANLDLSILETEIPRAVVDLAAFPNAVDVGAVVPVLFGNVAKVPLPYVREDVVVGQYFYLVGAGALTVTAAYRNGPNDTLYPIASTECYRSDGGLATTWAEASRTDQFSGYTVLTFVAPQLDFNNARHKIVADVAGLQPERNFARAVRTVLTNAVWGLGKTVDAASFNQAEADLNALSPPLSCDGALLAVDQAQHVLSSLLMPRGMRLGVNASGAFTLAVDRARAVGVALGDGTGDSPRNLVEVDPRASVSAGREAVSVLTLRYRRDLTTGALLLPGTRTLQSLGQPKELTNDFVSVATTADRIVDYLGKRFYAGQRRLRLTATLEARAVDVGDLVMVTYAPLGFSAETMEVLSVARELDATVLELRGYDATAYAYAPSSIPADPPVGTAIDFSRVAAAPPFGLAIAGSELETAADGGQTAGVIVQFSVAAANVEQAIVSYRRAGTTPWTPTAPTVFASGASRTSIQKKLSGLVTFQDYEISVGAVSMFGIASTGDPSLITKTMKSTTPPADPTAIAAAQGTGQSVNVTVTAARPSDWDHFNYYRAVVANGVAGSFALLPAASDPGRYHDDTVVYSTAVNSGYQYKATSVNRSGIESGYSPTSLTVVVVQLGGPDLGDGSIPGTKLVRGAVSGGAQVIVPGGYTSFTQTFQDVPGLAVTYTSTGGPVLLMLTALVGVSNQNATIPLTIGVAVRLLLDGNEVYRTGPFAYAAANGLTISWPLELAFGSTLAKGAHTIRVQYAVHQDAGFNAAGTFVGGVAVTIGIYGPVAGAVPTSPLILQIAEFRDQAPLA